MGVRLSGSGRGRVRAALLALLIVLAPLAPVGAAVLPAGFAEQGLAAGLDSPTAMQIAPDGRIFITLQGGQVRIWDPAVGLLPAPFLDVSVDARGERGLLGIALDPNFQVNRYVYVYYTVPTPAHNRISRFTAQGDVVVPGSEQVLVELEALTAATNHNGGALNFGPDGMLYAAVGENATAANAQTLNNRLGKIHRYDTTAFAQGGALIPASNPFYATAGGDNRSIWALGLRNPYTFAFNPGGGSPPMFINDVGQNTFEEINVGGAGLNYGWPNTSDGDFDPAQFPDFTRPTYSYEHANGACAITGGAFYAPPILAFGAGYANDYFFADFCGGWIRRLDPARAATDPQRVLPFASGLALPVDLKVAPDGSLYYLQRLGDHQLYRVTSTAAQPPAAPTGVTVTASGLTLQLSWAAVAEATSYVVEVGSASGASNLLVTDVGDVTQVAGPVPEGTYYLRVRAVNAVGTSAVSAQAQLTVTLTGSCVVPPPAPPSFAAQVSGLVTRLTWGAATDATSYRLEAGSASGLANLVDADLGRVTSFVAEAPAGTYFVRLRAANACGVGAPSSEIPVTLGCAVPSAAPTALASSVAGGLLTISWVGALGHASYVMEVGTAAEQRDLFVGNIGAAPLFQVPVSAVAAGTYYVRVRGVSACGLSAATTDIIVVLP